MRSKYVAGVVSLLFSIVLFAQGLSMVTPLSQEEIDLGVQSDDYYFTGAILLVASGALLVVAINKFRK